MGVKAAFDLTRDKGQSVVIQNGLLIGEEDEHGTDAHSRVILIKAERKPFW